MKQVQCIYKRGNDDKAQGVKQVIVLKSFVG